MKWLIVLLLIPLATAHGEHEHDGVLLPFGSYLQHIQGWSGNLSPGESTERTLAFGGQMLQEGWDLLFHGTTNQSLQARLTGTNLNATWQWNGTHTEFVHMPANDWPTLNVTNVGDGDLYFQMYFDQTCDCIGKSVPMQGGPLFFNMDAGAGDEITYAFNFVPVRQFVTTPDGDFEGVANVRVLEYPSQSEVANWTGDSDNWDDCAQMERFHGCLEVVAAPSKSGRHTLLLQTDHTMAGWSLQVHPTIQVSADERTQPLGFVWAFLAIAASVYVAKIRRQ